MAHEHSKDCGHGGGKCGCVCHKAGGVLIIAFGLTFLLGSLNVISQEIVSYVWPSILILGGLKHMCKGVCKCCSEG